MMLTRSEAFTLSTGALTTPTAATRTLASVEPTGYYGYYGHYGYGHYGHYGYYGYGYYGYGDIPEYGQCGGKLWDGTGKCVYGTKCVEYGPYYSQCMSMP